MKTIPILIATALALAGMTVSADAAKKKKHYRPVAPQAQCIAPWDFGATFSYGPCGNDYSGRRDPLSWEGPLNAWDRNRRDNANMMDH